MLFQKKKLIKLVFDKAKTEFPKGTKSSISAYLNSLFEEQHGFSKGEKSFVRYYNSLVESNTDYNIDDITLDQLSNYIGYESYNDFCDKENFEEEDIGRKTVHVEINHENESQSFTEKASKVVINITNSPVFTIPEFVTKNKNSFGIIGIILEPV